MQIPLDQPGVECGKWVAAGKLCPLLHSHMRILTRMRVLEAVRLRHP
jgi:hypothetical protein